MAGRKAVTVSLNEIAVVFGVTTRTILDWRKAGMPSRRESGETRFSLPECVRWRREQDREAATKDDDTSKEDRRRILRAEADLKELELHERSRSLCEVATYESEAVTFVGSFAAAVLGRMQQFERRMVQVSTPQEARKLVEEMQDDLMRGARQFADQLQAEAGADEIEEEAA